MAEVTATPQGGPESALATWRARMGLSQRAAAMALGVSLPAYQQWEAERSWKTGAPINPPLAALLAASALERGLPPVRGTRDEDYRAQGADDYHADPQHKFKPPYKIGTREYDQYERGWTQALKRSDRPES